MGFVHPMSCALVFHHGSVVALQVLTSSYLPSCTSRRDGVIPVCPTDWGASLEEAVALFFRLSFPYCWDTSDAQAGKESQHFIVFSSSSLKFTFISVWQRGSVCLQLRILLILIKAARKCFWQLPDSLMCLVRPKTPEIIWKKWAECSGKEPVATQPRGDMRDEPFSRLGLIH